MVFMIEFSYGFDDDQVEAMQAAAELADLIETETGGALSYTTDSLDLETQDPYNDPGILTLNPPDDPELTTFGTIWDDLMPDQTHDPYRFLDIINVGNVGIDAGPDSYDNYHVYRINSPDTLLSGLGVVVGGRTHITSELELTHGAGIADTDLILPNSETITVTTGDYHILNTAGVHVLGQAIQAALEYNDGQPRQTMAGGYFDD
jgi:hypothetical protein